MPDTVPAAPSPGPDDETLDSLGVLADPVRRALYRVVVAHGRPVGRGEAAEAAGVQRTLAAHHLDRLVEAGLLEAHFARPAGRNGGPGAGRPAKMYRRAPAETAVSLPPRDYGEAAHILAEAAERAGLDREVARTARAQGRAAGAALAPTLPEGDERARVLALLTARGYEPATADGPAIRLRNCPFHRLAEDFPPLVCGMNLGLLDGLLDGAGVRHYCARLDPVPGRCCVVVERDDGLREPPGEVT